MNPTVAALGQLAKFVGIPVAFFYEDAPRQQPKKAAVLRDVQRLIDQAKVATRKRPPDTVSRILDRLSSRLQRHILADP